MAATKSVVLSQNQTLLEKYIRVIKSEIMFLLVEMVLLCATMAAGATSTDLLISGPQSVAATFGSSVAFYCVGLPDIVGIRWYLNEIPSSSFISDGVMVKSVLSGKDNYTSELIVDTSYAYNSTMIKCTVIGMLPNGTLVSDESETVMLIIQGQLGAPQNVYATAIVCELATVYWVNPFSYPGIPILAVSISLNSQPEAVSVNKTESIRPSGEEDNYDITLSVCQDPCLPITISVTAVNGAGQGEPGFGTIYFPQAPNFSEPRHVIHYMSTNKLELQVYVEETLENGDECAGRTPVAGDIKVTCYTQFGDNQHSFADNFPFTPVKSGDTYTHTASNIPEYSFCSYNISLSSTEIYKTVSPSIMFSTHPVQDVDYQLGAREVTVICTFLQESLASGCLVVVQCAENFRREVKISRGVSMVAVSDIITDIPTGHCDMLAYDIDKDGVQGTVPAANNSFEVVIVDVSTPTPSSTSVQSVSNLPSEKGNTTLIYVIIATVGVVVILGVMILIVVIVVICICYAKKKTGGIDFLQVPTEENTIPLESIHQDITEIKVPGPDEQISSSTQTSSVAAANQSNPPVSSPAPLATASSKHEDQSVGEFSQTKHLETQVHESDEQISSSTPTSSVIAATQGSPPTTSPFTKIPGAPAIAGSKDEDESEKSGTSKEELPLHLLTVSGIHQRRVSFAGSTRPKPVLKKKVRSASLGDEEEELLIPIEETQDDKNALHIIPYKLVEREIGHVLCGRWRDLAHALGFSNNEIYYIAMTYGMNDLNCMCKGVIKAWLNDKPQWEKMVKALEKIGENERAQQLLMKYVKGISQHVPSHKLLGQIATAVEDQWKLVAAFLDVPKFLVEEWQEEHSNDHSKCITCVFEWWEKSRNRYKLATLLDVLENPAINKQDLAIEIKQRCAKGPERLSVVSIPPQSPAKFQSSPLTKYQRFTPEGTEEQDSVFSTD